MGQGQVSSTKIGLEIELTYNLSNNEWRELYAKYCEKQKLCSTFASYDEFKVLLMKEFEDNPLLYKKPHQDGGGLELSLKPFTEEEYGSSIIYGAIRRMLVRCWEFKLYPSEKDGIHLNIDIEAFTPTVLKAFLGVIGPDSEFKSFMSKFIGRPKSADKLGNIDTLLGDFSGTNTAVTSTLWARYVDSMIEDIDKEYCTVNMCFNKNGRPILEWRWFGSSLDINRIYALLQFVFSILEINYLDNNTPSLKLWVKQVIKNRLTRSHLLKELRKYPETRKYLGLHRYI